jgi:DNA-binding transcriptional ArsR family regulator
MQYGVPMTDIDCTDLPHVPLAQRLSVPAAVRDRAARMLSAAGEPSRLALLEQLEGRELCVSDLVTITGDPMPTISQRLRVLKTEGLLRSRREGKHVYYTLADGHVQELLRNILRHAAELAG